LKKKDDYTSVYTMTTQPIGLTCRLNKCSLLNLDLDLKDF